MSESTIFLGEKHKKIAEPCASLACLSKIAVESPQDYVRRIIAEKGLSHVKVAQRARKLGGELSPGYVNSIIQGHVKSPGIDMIFNLSLGLGEPVEDLIARYLGQILPHDTSGFKKSAAYALYEEIELLENEQDRAEAKILLEAVRRDIQRRTAKS